MAIICPNYKIFRSEKVIALLRTVKISISFSSKFLDNRILHEESYNG